MDSVDLCLSAYERSCSFHSLPSVWRILWHVASWRMCCFLSFYPWWLEKHTVFFAIVWENLVLQISRLDTSCRIDQGRVIALRLCDAIKVWGSCQITFFKHTSSDFPGGSDGKSSAYNAGDPSRVIWRRQWHPTPVLLPGKSQTEEPGRLQYMGLRRVGHDWATLLSFFRCPVQKFTFLDIVFGA